MNMKHFAWRRDLSALSSMRTSVFGRSNRSASAAYSVAPMYAVVITLSVPCLENSLRASRSRLSPDCLMNETTISILSDSRILVLSSSARMTGSLRVIAILRSSLTVDEVSETAVSEQDIHPTCVRQ